MATNPETTTATAQPQAREQGPGSASTSPRRRDEEATRLVSALGWRIVRSTLAGSLARAVSHRIAGAPRRSPLRAVAFLRSRLKGELTAPRLHEILSALDGSGVNYWLAGGWGVDALVGHQSRRHDDVDIVIDQFDRCAPIACRALSLIGFEEIERHEQPTSWAGDQWTLEDARAARIDLLSLHEDFVRDRLGSLDTNSSLFAQGRIGSRSAPCLSAPVQRLLHDGLSRPVDRHDVRILAASPI